MRRRVWSGNRNWPAWGESARSSWGGPVFVGMGALTAVVVAIAELVH